MSLRDDVISQFPNALSERDDATYAAAMYRGRTKRAPVSAASVRGLLYARGRWNAIVKKANAARANADTSDCALACQTLYDLSVSDQSVPMDNQVIYDQVSADLDLMVVDAVLGADDKIAVLGLAEVPDRPSTNDVSDALNEG